ncbi:MAG: sugar transferase [Pseudomonadota bacterium]
MLRLLKQYFPIRNIIFYLIEGLVIFGSFLLATAILSSPRFLFLDSSVCLRILLITFICQACLYYNDLYDFKVVSSISEVSIRLLQALGVSSIILALIYWIFPSVIINQLVFILSVVFLLIFIIGWRIFYIFCINNGWFNQKIIILGTSSLAIDIITEINAAPDCGYSVVALILGSEKNEATNDILKDLFIINDKENFCDVVKQMQAEKIIVALKERRGTFPTQELIRCRTAGIEVLEGSSFYETLTGKVLVTKINPSWLIFSDGFRKSKFQTIVKRMEDIFISLIMLIILSPLLLVTSILIKLESKGPILFSQDRVGQNKNEYMMHKFRSMVVDAEKSTGPVWAQKNDMRITRVGRVIRKFRIDELPQLWDVLIGRMSMVGPRPERKFFTDSLEQQIPFYSERFVVKPGLTGWAQVSYDYGATVDDAIEKLNYDLFYIKNLSITMDIVIVLRTVKTVLFGRGAR